MNTAFNFLSMPKDSASSAVSGDLSPDSSAQMAVNSADKRQDLADGGEKNASFAKVLNDESHQKSAQKGSEQSPKADDSEGKAADSKPAGTQAVNTNETASEAGDAEEIAVTAVDSSSAEAVRDAGNNILDALTTRIQTNPEAEPDSVVTPQDSIADISAGKAGGTEQSELDSPADDTRKFANKLNSGEQIPLQEQAKLSSTAGDHSQIENAVNNSARTTAEQPIGLKSTVHDTSNPLSIASDSAKTGSDRPTSESNLNLDNAQQSFARTSNQVTAPAGAQVNSDEQSPHGRPVEITAEQIQARAAVQKNSNELANQVAAGTQAAAQGEEALAAAASSELKESHNKSNSNPVSASLESLPAAGKSLPNSGKILPAGLFFQGEGEASVASKGEQATQPVNLNSAIAGKTTPAALQNFDKGIEITGDTFMRNLLSASAATPEASAPLASAPLSTDSTTSPLLNPLLQVTADKALQAARTSTTGGAESAMNLNITAQAGSAEWQSQLSGRIRWMGNLNISSAELKLHPAELGTVEIKISTEDDQTRISFITNNAAAKEVIESTLPRLREMLGDGGLNLEQGDVAQRDLSEEKQAHEALNNGNQTDNEDGEDAELQQANLHITRNSTSQIDHYV